MFFSRGKREYARAKPSLRVLALKGRLRLHRDKVTVIAHSYETQEKFYKISSLENIVQFYVLTICYRIQITCFCTLRGKKCKKWTKKANSIQKVSRIVSNRIRIAMRSDHAKRRLARKIETNRPETQDRF